MIQKVTWTGGSVPTEEDSLFQFLASPPRSKTYTFAVRQTYSDGSVVDWSGPESSDSPAPTIEAKSSLGGGGSSTLAIVALSLGGVALVVGGRRPPLPEGRPLPRMTLRRRAVTILVLLAALLAWPAVGVGARRAPADGALGERTS